MSTKVRTSASICLAVSSEKSRCCAISRPRKICSSFLPKVIGPSFAHAELADHLAGELGGALDVAAGAGGHLLEEDLFGAATAHEGGEAGFEIVLGDGVLVFLGEVDGDAEGHAAGDDGDLVERVRVLAQGGDEGVTGLVVGGDALLFVGEEH